MYSLTWCRDREGSATLYDKAAAYCTYIVNTNPFVDGDKRTGLLAAIHFLRKNGFEPDFDQEKMYDVIIRALRGQAQVSDIAQVLRGTDPGLGKR